MLDTVEEIAEYLGTIEVSVQALEIPKRQAKREYLYPSLGRGVVREIEDSEDAELLSLYKEAYAQFIMVKDTPRLEVRVTDNGLVRAGDGESSSPIAYKNQVDNLNVSYEDAGYAALDDLIEYMITESFQPWLDSDKYIESQSLIISSGGMFNSFYKLKHPALLYEYLKQSIRYVQNLILAKDFGDDLLSAMLGFKDSTEEEEKNIYIKLQSAVAYLSVAESLNELQVKITSEGLTLSGNSTGAHYNKVKSAADGRSISDAKDALKSKGLAYIEDARIRLFKLPAFEPEKPKRIEINKLNSGAFSM